MKKTRVLQANPKLVSRMSQIVKREQRKRPKTQVVSPTEQLRRFMADEERWRLHAGLVTPKQYQVYSDKMMGKLRERQEAERLAR